MRDTADGEDFGACFIAGERGRLFAVKIFPPDERVRAQILFVPPFGEELNCARRFMSTLARQLAAKGLGCWLLDLYGTGDSEGDFKDATWTGWFADLSAARAWLHEREADRPLWLLGIRTGALLAAESAAGNPAGLAGLAMIHPVERGETFVNQLLRLRMMAAMARGVKETTKDMRARLSEGETLHVAGYPLSPSLVSELDARSMDDFTLADHHRLLWYETGRPAEEPQRRLSPPAHWPCERAADRYVPAESFWSIQEPTVPEGLLTAVAADFEWMAS